MKVDWCSKVGYRDIDPAFRMRLGALSRMLQEAAVNHSERVGIHSRDLVQNGAVWVVNKMAFDIVRLPAFGENVRVVTWHRGSRGFRAFRDFEIWVMDERLVSVTTLWLYIDLVRKRPRRIPTEWSAIYTVENVQALDEDLNDGRPSPAEGESTGTRVTMRSSDFDPQGHVNNTAYFDFLETGLKRSFGEKAAFRRLRIHFSREIGPLVEAVRVSLTPAPAGAVFRIHDDHRTFVAGEIEYLSSVDRPN
jgi:acyl-ACP thioesterase